MASTAPLHGSGFIACRTAITRPRALLQSAADGCAPDKMEARLAATELARLGP